MCLEQFLNPEYFKMSAPEWMTYITAASSLISAGATVAIAVFANVQIDKATAMAKEQLERSSLQQKKWSTLQACNNYDLDPVIEEATKEIWKHKSSGYANQENYKREIVVVLNYLDSLSIGISQGLYEEAIVKDHLGPIFIDMVRKHLEPSDTPLSPDDYAHTMEYYKKWTKKVVEFSDQT